MPPESPTRARGAAIHDDLKSLNLYHTLVTEKGMRN